MEDRSIKKKEAAGLRAYQKKSLAARAAGALLALAAAGIAGYLGKKAGQK